MDIKRSSLGYIRTAERKGQRGIIRKCAGGRHFIRALIRVTERIGTSRISAYGVMSVRRYFFGVFTVLQHMFSPLYFFEIISSMLFGRSLSHMTCTVHHGTDGIKTSAAGARFSEPLPYSLVRALSLQKMPLTILFGINYPTYSSVTGLICQMLSAYSRILRSEAK